MISRVVIKNFKSIGEAGVDLELKPLTLLVGPNGGGKSSILEAIAVASQRNTHSHLTDFQSPSKVMHESKVCTVVIEVHFAPIGEETSGGYKLSFGAETHFDFQPLSENEAVRTNASKLFDALRRNAFLIRSVRGDVPYLVDARGRPAWVGLRGENLLLLLAIIFGQLEYRRTADRVAIWGKRFGIEELNAGFRGDIQTGSDYRDSQLKVALDLALASSGARQILTVITQLFWAPEGSLLMIEEPEISLHPKAQIDVLEMFAEAIREDSKQIIATTHSHILLQALGYAVHKRWIKSQDIAVYHIEKGRAGTKATSLPLGKNGYIKNWVPSYTKVERQLLQEWAKTLPRA